MPSRCDRSSTYACAMKEAIFTGLKFVDNFLSLMAVTFAMFSTRSNDC